MVLLNGIYYRIPYSPVLWSIYFPLVSVKYLREVTPYFRKASIISEVGWELQRGFLGAPPPAPPSPQRADTRYIPLQLTCLGRNLRHHDPGEFVIYCIMVETWQHELMSFTKRICGIWRYNNLGVISAFSWTNLVVFAIYLNI